MKEIHFISPSDRELEDAVEYYNDQMAGLIPEDDKILITAIAHQHRSPEYLIERLK